MLSKGSPREQRATEQESRNKEREHTAPLSEERNCSLWPFARDPLPTYRKHVNMNLPDPEEGMGSAQRGVERERNAERRVPARAQDEKAEQ